jgi:orotidine-5'-phosphate decarboxylase
MTPLDPLVRTTRKPKGDKLTPKDRLIVALDVPGADANRLISELKDVVGMFKVGSQLFATTGPALVETIVRGGNRVFLDLKFHDIPHQVAGAARAAAELNVSLFTLHASGGTEMMKRAVDAVADVSEHKLTVRSRVLAVTVLTSIDSTTLAEIGVKDSPSDSVARLAKLAETAGVDGVVSSPNEAAAIRSMTKPEFLIVTPGIRASNSTEPDDQKRVATAANALRAGASYIVVGRPITSAAEPARAAQAIIDELIAVENAEQANAMNV